jgi:hypothetical protein
MFKENEAKRENNSENVWGDLIEINQRMLRGSNFYHSKEEDKRYQSEEPWINLSRSWHRGHSHTYSPMF